MRYLITPNEVTAINETSGTIQNIDQINKVELSESTEFTNNIILYPSQAYNFQNQLYARLFDSGDLPVELRVIPIQLDSGGGSSGGGAGDYTIASDTEFANMLDEILPTIEGGSSGGDDSQSGDDTDSGIATDDEFNKMLDDIGL